MAKAKGKTAHQAKGAPYGSTKGSGKNVGHMGAGRGVGGMGPSKGHKSSKGRTQGGYHGG